MMFYKKHIMLIIYILSILYSIFLCFSIGLVYSSLTMNIINQLLALDLSLLQSARGWVWSEYAPIVQLTGEGIVVFWALFLVTLWLYGVFKKDNQYKIQALTIFLTVVSVFAIYAIINLGIPQWRPGAMSIPGAIAPLIPHPIDNSFPSGHALFSWAFLVALFRFFSRCYILTGSVLIIVGITLVSRVIGGVHYPGDILGGLIIGSTWAYLLQPYIDILSKKVSPFFIKIASYIKL